MHIAILAPSDKSFVSHFLSNISINDLPDGYLGAPFIGTIAHKLLDLNHKVTLITTSKAISNDYTTKIFCNGNFTWVVVPSRPKSFRFNGFKFGRIVDLFTHEINVIVDQLNEIKPDIVHAHWSYEFTGAALKSNLPYLVTVHDNAYQIFKYFKNPYRLFRLMMSELNLFRVKYASTVSPYMFDYVNRRCAMVEIIPNPVLISLKEEDIHLLLDKKISSLNNPSIIMINSGWDSRKNGKKALVAFKHLLSKIPNAKLHLFGGGTELNGLAYYDALELGISNVYFNGQVPHEQLIQVLNKAHILLHPSLEESFGVVLIEAMSLCVPAVGGKFSGAVPWVINNNDLLVDVTSPIDISNKLIDILSNANSYRLYCFSIFNNVTQRFSVDTVVHSYLNYYNNIIANNVI
jgi:glycosyltransferase involved in cell wall biosynthesis